MPDLLQPESLLSSLQNRSGLVSQEQSNSKIGPAIVIEFLDEVYRWIDVWPSCEKSIGYQYDITFNLCGVEIEWSAVTRFFGTKFECNKY